VRSRLALQKVVTVVQMLSKSCSETENTRTNCVAALQTHQCSGSPQKAYGSPGSDLGQGTRSMLTPKRADCCLLRCLLGATAVQPLLLCRANPTLPAACSPHDVECRSSSCLFDGWMRCLLSAQPPPITIFFFSWMLFYFFQHER